MRNSNITLRWAIIAIFIVILVLSAACDDPSATTGQHDTGRGGSSDIEPTGLETITIFFPGYPLSTDGQPKNLRSINEMLKVLNERTEVEIGTRIEFVWSNSKDDYEKQLAEMAKSDDAPDAYYIFNDSMKDRLCSQELLKDITDLVPSYLGGYYPVLLDAWGDELDSVWKYEGRIFTIPSNTVYTNRYCVIAREDLAEKYAPEGISDLNDYFAFLRAVKANESNEICPGMLHSMDLFNAYLFENGYIQDLQLSVYTKYEDGTFNPVFMHQTDAYLTVYGIYTDLMENGMLFGGTGKKNVTIRNGTIASVMCGISSAHSEYPNFESSYRYRMYPLNMDKVCLKSSCGNHCSLGINVNSKNEDRVLIFISWLQSSQENYDLLMYGIKDWHYKLLGKHLDFSTIEYQNTRIVNWWCSDVFRNYLYERPYPFEPEDYAEFIKGCAFTNTVSYPEFLEAKGCDPHADEKVEQGFKNIQGNYFRIWDEYSNFFQALDQGVTKEMELNKIIEEKGLQNDIDIVLDYFRTCLKKEND